MVGCRYPVDIKWVIYQSTCRLDNFFSFMGQQQVTLHTVPVSFQSQRSFQSNNPRNHWLAESLNCFPILVVDKVSWFTDTQVKSDKLDGWQLSLVFKLAVLVYLQDISVFHPCCRVESIVDRDSVCFRGDLAAIWWQDHWRTHRTKLSPFM